MQFRPLTTQEILINQAEILKSLEVKQGHCPSGKMEDLARTLQNTCVSGKMSQVLHNGFHIMVKRPPM